MEFFKPGRVFDFMRYRRILIPATFLMSVASVIGVFFPGLNYGIDFAGGTEVQVAFRGAVTSGELRDTIESLGYESPDVVAVSGGAPNEYLLRVKDVSALSPQQRDRVTRAIHSGLGTPEREVETIHISPGGDKISID